MLYEIWSGRKMTIYGLLNVFCYGSIEANSFQEACDNFHWYGEKQFYDPRFLTYYKCNLYTNEQDASWHLDYIGKFKSNKCDNFSQPSFYSSLHLRLHFWLEHSDNVEWYKFYPSNMVINNFDQFNKYFVFRPDFITKFRGLDKYVLITIDNSLRNFDIFQNNKLQQLIIEKLGTDQFEIWKWGPTEVFKVQGGDIEDLIKDDRVKLNNIN